MNDVTSRRTKDSSGCLKVPTTGKSQRVLSEVQSTAPNKFVNRVVCPSLAIIENKRGADRLCCRAAQNRNSAASTIAKSQTCAATDGNRANRGRVGNTFCDRTPSDGNGSCICRGSYDIEIIATGGDRDGCASRSASLIIPERIRAIPCSRHG